MILGWKISQNFLMAIISQKGSSLTRVIGSGMVPIAKDTLIRAIFMLMGGPLPTIATFMIGCGMVPIAEIAEDALIRAIATHMGVGALLPANKALMIGYGMAPIADGALMRAFFLSMGLCSLILTTNRAAMLDR